MTTPRFTTPPPASAGELWEAETAWDIYVVNNLINLDGRAGGSAGGADQIVVSGSDAVIRRLTVPPGAIVVGTADGIAVLLIGTEGQVLKVVNGTLAWVDA